MPESIRKSVLITGASGYVGASIYQELKHENLDVHGTYLSTKLFEELIHCDLTDRQQVSDLFSRVKPDVVIHVAANASNGTCEENPEKAIDLNVNATRYLVEFAREYSSAFIFVSTFAAYNPKGVYGQSKVEAEEIVAQLGKYMILRPSLIIGLSPNTQNDRPFNRFVKDLQEGKKVVEYDSSWEFNVTFLDHVVSICRQIVIEDKFTNYMVPIVTNHLTSRYKLAKELLEPFGISVEPIDKKASIKEPAIDWEIYQHLELPTYDYAKGIQTVLNQMRRELA